jgi:CHAT domain-containing protein
VADPGGDLAGAAREADAMSGIAGLTWVRLVREEATRPRVMEALAHARLLHFAGHGEARDDGVASALRLSGDARLTAGDVLVLPSVPRWAVLSACDSGAVGESAVAELGVAQAFVLAGSERVVATSRPLDDDAPVALLRALWERLAADPTVRPERALADALRSTPDAARTFRVLGP